MAHGVEEILIKRRFKTESEREYAWNNCTIAEEIIDKAYKNLQIMGETKSIDELKKEISGYATYDDSETFAECLARKSNDEKTLIYQEIDYNKDVRRKMMITSREAVWRPYIISHTELGEPIWKEDTPDWIKQALWLFQHKMHHDEFFDLIEAHGVYDNDENKERVWRDYVQGWEDVRKPIWKENTPDWIKEAYSLSKQKDQTAFYALLEAHGVYDDEKE